MKNTASIVFRVQAPIVIPGKDGDGIISKTATVNGPFTFQITTTGEAAATCNVSGALPPGITYDSASRKFAGTPTKAGPWDIIISVYANSAAVNAANPDNVNSDSAVLHIVVAPAPAVPKVDPHTATNISGPLTAFSFTPAATVATGSPAVTGWAASKTLPSGISLNATTGVLSGTFPAAGTVNIGLKAQNSVGWSAVQTFSFVVALPPVITVLNSVTKYWIIGQAYSWPVRTNVAVSSVTVANRPAWLAFNEGTDTLSGTPTAGSVDALVTINATSTQGATTAPEVLIKIQGQIVISGQDGDGNIAKTGTVGTLFSYQVATTGNSMNFCTVSTLPPGITFDSTMKKFGGTPTRAGNYSVTLQAFANPAAVNTACTANNDPINTDSATVKFSIAAAPAAPVVTPRTTTSVSGPLTAFSFTPAATVATGSPAVSEWAPVEALPSGVTINTSTGALSGTFPNSGTFNIKLKAKNTVGWSDPVVFTFIVAAPPAINIDSDLSTRHWEIGKPYTLPPIHTSITAETVTVSGRPSWLAFNTSTNVLSGTPPVGSTDVLLTINVTSAQGATDSAQMTIEVEQPPQVSFTSAPPTNAVTGIRFSYPIKTSIASTITAALTAGGSLPAWLKLTGSLTAGWLLSGTPATGDITAALAVTLTATTALQSTAKQYLTVAVTTPPKPNINSDLTPQTAIIGETFAYPIRAESVLPVTYGATNLPAGLSVNTATGLISGTPSVAGVNSVTISATNANGTDTDTLIISVVVPPDPVLQGPFDLAGIKGTYISFNIVATNAPTSYGATNLPAGMSVNTATGLISGTPSVAGVNAVTISATNANGSTSGVLMVRIATPPAPVISSGTSAGAVVGRDFTFPILTDGATGYGASGLPPGLSVNTATGLISGKPTTAGIYAVTISATNANGTTSANVTIDVVAAPAPHISPPFTSVAKVGTAWSFPLSSDDSTATFSVNANPLWMTLNTSTNVLSGTPTVAGRISVLITCKNAAGTGEETKPLVIDVADTGLSNITSELSVHGTKGNYFSYSIVADATPTSYTIPAAKLPTGFTLSGSNLTGTPSESGYWEIPITVVNSVGSRTQTLTLLIASVTSRNLAEDGNKVESGNLGTDLSWDVVSRIADSLPTAGAEALFFMKDGEEALINIFFKKNSWLVDADVTNISFGARGSESGDLVLAAVDWKRQANPVVPFFSMKALFDTAGLATIKKQIPIGSDALFGELIFTIAAPWAGGVETVRWSSQLFPGKLLV